MLIGASVGCESLLYCTSDFHFGAWPINHPVPKQPMCEHSQIPQSHFQSDAFPSTSRAVFYHLGTGPGGTPCGRRAFLGIGRAPSSF